LNASSQEELENRLHSLTETLIQKQAMIEALSTEKSSLGLQLERVEVSSDKVDDSAPVHHLQIICLVASIFAMKISKFNCCWSFCIFFLYYVSPIHFSESNLS